jgi:plasmid stability protein
MTLTITLPEPVERRLAEQAAAVGKSVEALAGELIEKAVGPPGGGKPFAEIAEPFRLSFEESGMTEEELDELVEQAREEIWQEQHGYPSKRTDPPARGTP